MTPLRIAGATRNLVAPKNWDPDEHGSCSGLWVRDEEGTVASAWEPTPAELAKLVAGGHVVLTIVGGQPAVALGVEIPNQEGEHR